MYHNCYSALAGALIAASASAASDVEKISVQNLLENDYVQVHRIMLDPGERLALHAGDARIVYSLSQYTMSWSEAGSTGEKSWGEGDVHAHESQNHALKNTGKTIADLLVVARTGAPLSAASQRCDPDNLAEMSRGYAILISDLAGARVLRVSLPPGASQPEHCGAPRVVYSLNDYTVLFTGPDGQERKIEFSAGDAHWHDAGTHAVSNIGDETARFLTFEYELRHHTHNEIIKTSLSRLLARAHGE